MKMALLSRMCTKKAQQCITTYAELKAETACASAGGLCGKASMNHDDDKGQRPMDSDG